MERRRAGTTLTLMVAAAALLLALLLSSCGVASAAGKHNITFSSSSNKVAKKLKPGETRPSGKYKFISLTRKGGFGKKRNYQVSCADEGGPSCYVGCRPDCPNSCFVYCDYCLSFCPCDLFPGSSCGDPRFTGGDGNTFYFHGKKGDNFCIVTDTDLHINAHFIGNHNPDLKRDFTWVQALGVTFGDNHRLFIGARRAVEWDEDEDHIQVTFDGEPVDLDTVRNARWTPEGRLLPGGGLSVTRMKDVNTVVVQMDGLFAITANAVPITDDDNRIHKYGKTASDSLVHLDLGFQFHNLTKDVDGVLGQTYRPNYVTSLDIGAKMPIMGGAPKYHSKTLFSTDCAVSRFHRPRRDEDAIAAAADGVGVTTYAS